MIDHWKGEGVFDDFIGLDESLVHIAAHGQYSDNPFESGVVIGDNEFFTTANVAAMRRVPRWCAA